MALNVFSKESGLSKKTIVIKDVIPFKNKGELVFRIFNLSPKGYIVVSAEDNTIPILGYGLESNFSFDDAPPALLFLLGEYKNEISFIKENRLEADEKIKSKWATYSSPEYISLKSYSPGSYLLETNWGQGSPYNNDCPDDPNVTGDSPCRVGCTAVALGQILNYWECKVFPDGSNTYTPPNFNNSLTVNFYDQDYDWDDIGTDISATSEFLYHCGVAVNMEYTDSASGASSYSAEYAMENYFGFETSGLKSKNSYSSSTWINMLKSDIDAGRPIYYDGTDNTTSPISAHAWVIDGYKINNSFHCNWGWNGSYSGDEDWFYLTDLTPGSHNYNANQHAIIGAEPILDACSWLSGASTICYSDTFYSVTIPSLASVEWSKSASLQQVSTNNTSPTYIVKAATSYTTAEGNVTAVIKNSQGNTFLTRTKNVWVGKPDYTLLDIDIDYEEIIACGYASAEADYDGTAGIDAYEWYMPDAQDWEIEEESGAGPDNKYVEIEYWEDPPPSYDDIYIRAHNTCGWSNWKGETFNVTNDCGGFFMMITPNPSTTETTLSIESTSTEITFDETAQWEIEVYSSTQTLKEKITNIKGNSTKIQTQGWKEGVYVVRVKYEDEILIGKLVVKK